MRAKDFIIEDTEEDLTEIENFPAYQFVGGKSMLDKRRLPAKRNLQPLLGGTNLLYAVDQDRHGQRVVIVEPGVPTVSNPQVVAALYLDTVDYLPNTVQVTSITVDEDYRGRGLAKALYGIVFTKMRKNLLSGDAQTPGGKRNWMSLVNMPGVQVKGLVRIDNDIFDLNRNRVSSNYQKYIDQTIDQIMELGGQFFHKDNDFSYWLFDVVPGKGQLQPYVQNSISKLYGYDARNLLLATWNKGLNESQQDLAEDNPDYDEDRYLKSDPGTPLSFPKGTTLVNVSDVYDWYKLGMAVSDLDDADPRTFNKGVPHTVFAFGSEEEEHKMIPLLKRLGFSLHDIDSPEDYAKAIRADEAIAHLEEMVSRQVINDDENQRAGPMTPIDPVKLAQLNQKINTDQADSTLPSSMDWTQQIGNTGGDAEGWQKAQGRVGDVNIGLAADYNHPQSNFAQQRGINLGYGPASVNIGDRGAVSGSYNIPVGKDSSVSLSASGQKEFGLTGIGAQYQNQSGFSAGVNQPNFPGEKPQFNVGYSAKFEDAESEVAESTSPSITVKDAKRALLAMGFEPTGRGKGSHDVWKDSSGLLFTIPVHGKDLEYGVAKTLLKLIRSRQTELDEMAGSINVGISQYLAKRGYQYLGGGIDKQAYLESSTGQVLIVFGYRKEYSEFSPDQRMFINWINYCNKNKNNPHLPRFSGFETFQFQGKNYIQARMEALRELPDEVGYLVGNIEEVTMQMGRGNFDRAMKILTGYAQDSSYEGDQPLWYEVKDSINFLGGPEAAKNLLKTVKTVQQFARKHNYSIDLHRGNYMQRPDGTIVVNDPFVIWERNL